METFSTNTQEQKSKESAEETGKETFSLFERKLFIHVTDTQRAAKAELPPHFRNYPRHLPSISENWGQRKPGAHL